MPLTLHLQAKQQITAIFKSANSLPEEELTEEAFTVFLDTIKQLSEYVDQDDVDSLNFEVIDDISSGMLGCLAVTEYLCCTDMQKIFMVI